MAQPVHSPLLELLRSQNMLDDLQYEEALAEHERIVDAIARHDPQAAADAMRAHLTRANALYQQLIRQT